MSMNNEDKKLGMNKDISRRDFINGVGIALGSSAFGSTALSKTNSAQDEFGYYPPKLMGMRGSHPGSFEVAHLIRDGAKFEKADIDEEYDLVVVGAGISGLSAAYFYKNNVNKDAKILILDNHDDFGGHAKRNEFTYKGEKLIGFGGTMFISAPSTYPEIAKNLINDIGIDVNNFYNHFDQNLYSSFDLKRGVFFDRERFGNDYLAVGDQFDKKMLAECPISETAKKDLIRLYESDKYYLPNMPESDYYNFLNNMSYETYLKDYVKVNDEVIAMMVSSARGVWAVNIDAFPAASAWVYGYPGFKALYDYYGDYGESDPNIFHFPDGNASIARLLVRKMIPASASGRTMQDIVTSTFNYNELDRNDNNIRIRLSSTALRVRHQGNDFNAKVDVSYYRDGKVYRVEAKKCIMACYNAIIPRLCPEMPELQKNALKNCIRAPLVYTNVLLKNWKSFVKLGVRRVDMSGFLHHNVRLDYPISMGDYKFSSDPSKPVIIHLQSVPGEYGNPSARQQFLAGQRQLLTTPFDEFERSIRDQLTRLLSPGGFDASEDILGITVNRWPHGYAYGYDPESDQVAFDVDSWPTEKRHWKTASKKFGNISIASTDSASNAMSEAAIVEADRAVRDIR